MAKNYKIIAPDRFLTTRVHDGTVTVLLGGRLMASSLEAVLLSEGDRAPVAYLPKRDVDSARLEPSHTEYQCRWKGDAEYFNVKSDEDVVSDGAWGYPEAPDDLEVLRDRVAFDASRFDIQFSDAACSTTEGPQTAPQVETVTE